MDPKRISKRSTGLAAYLLRAGIDEQPGVRRIERAVDVVVESRARKKDEGRGVATTQSPRRISNTRSKRRK